MKQATSLEEEKRRLLEQLESSRAVYRRMLTNTEEPVDTTGFAPAAYDYAPPISSRNFPKSQTMRVIMDHPYLLAAGAAALILAGRKGLSRRRSRPKPLYEQDADTSVKKTIAATTFGTTLATTAAMLLRNPAQLQAAVRAVMLAMNYYKSRRGNPHQRFE